MGVAVCIAALMAELAPAFHPANAISEIADFIGDPVAAAQFPQARLRWRNDRAARQVGLDTLSDAAWIEHFGRFVALPGSLPQPLALRYHGHQFRVYNPDLGDGRGFLFAQLRDDAGRLMDLGTKGSGQTPYSRAGDGRLTLKGAVRELLATELLEALGVPTSRTFSIIETGEALHRGDEPSPTRSAVLVRLSHGHIRIGSFQRLYALGDHDALERLTAYALRHYYGGGGDAPALLEQVAARCAALAARYMAAGFVHGVLNSDNINISGESFDYGPWRFAPTYDPDFTAAYFDHAGLYAFGRQAEAIYWNLMQLAISLSPLADSAALSSALAPFPALYREALGNAFAQRLGRRRGGAALADAVEGALAGTDVPLAAFFRDWHDPARPADHARPAFDAVAAALATLPHAGGANPAPETLLIEEVEAIWSAIAAEDDWQPLYDKVARIREFGAALDLRPAPGRQGDANGGTAIL